MRPGPGGLEEKHTYHRNSGDKIDIADLIHGAGVPWAMLGDLGTIGDRGKVGAKGGNGLFNGLGGQRMHL